MRFPKHSISISLSLKFTLVLALAVIAISTGLISLIDITTHSQRNEELKKASNEIAYSIKDGSSILKHKDLPPLPYYITFLVYSDSQQAIIYTNDPFLPILPVTGKKSKIYRAKNYFTDGDLFVMYYTQFLTINEENFLIQTCLNMYLDSSYRFSKQIKLFVGIAFIPVSILSFFILLMIIRITINPVVKMTQMARQISSTNLDTLLPFSKKQNELDELAGTFNELFTRLKKDFERERQFTSDVSHELKTPVTVIMGQANLLKRWGKDDPEQLEKSLNTIHEESKSMNAIITNLLQLARLENNQTTITTEPINLKKLCERLKRETLSINPDAEILINPNTDIEIETNEELLHQVFTIIVSNSIKFVKSNLKINIYASRNENETEIFIEDNGNGFSEENLDHIFERFYRGDSSHTRSTTGNGLGLSIAKTIITSLKGTIFAYNAKPSGAGIKILLR